MNVDSPTYNSHTHADKCNSSPFPPTLTHSLPPALLCLHCQPVAELSQRHPLVYECVSVCVELQCGEAGRRRDSPAAFGCGQMGRERTPGQVVIFRMPPVNTPHPHPRSTKGRPIVPKDSASLLLPILILPLFMPSGASQGDHRLQTHLQECTGMNM